MNACCLAELIRAAKIEKIVGVCAGFEYEILLDAYNYHNAPHTLESQDIVDVGGWAIKTDINPRPSELIGDFIAYPKITVRRVEDAHSGHRLESASLKGEVLFLEFSSNCV